MTTETAASIVAELRTLGTESIRKVLLKHGAPDSILGVKVEELKKFQKRIKQDYQLALDLYDTGISDAMYLAGLIADDSRMTRKDLQRWVKQAPWQMISEYTVPWVAAGSPQGYAIALEWIDSRQEKIAAAGWATLASLVAITPDDRLDLQELTQLLGRVKISIHQQPNRVRLNMNDFVIAVGVRVAALHQEAAQAADMIGAVQVDMGETSCVVPLASARIAKAVASGKVGQKRKSAKC